MRWADILIDLAAVAKASKSVGSKHLEFRARQWDRYGKTSSIARSLRHQQQPQPGPASYAAGKEEPQPGPSEDDVLSESRRAGPSAPADPVTTPAPGLTHSSGPSLVEQHDKYKSLSQQRAGPESVYDEIPGISSLKKAPASYETAKAQSPEPVPPRDKTQSLDDAPVDADITNVFHTSRGAHLLDGKPDYIGKKRPVAAPSAPSWFKDYGHGKKSSEVAPTAEAADLSTEKIKDVEIDVKPQSDAERSKPPPGQLSSTATATATVQEPQQPAAKPDLTPEASSTPTRSSEKERTQMFDEVLAQAAAQPSSQTGSLSSSEVPLEQPAKPAYVLRESKVPSTRFGRLWNYGGLAAGMLGGAITEGFSRGLGGGGQGSVLLSAGNMERLVAKLSRMRGAALKFGQMMSFQDAKMLPPQIQEVLQRVQDKADYMPAWQRDRVMAASLGAEWRDLYDEFDDKPIAAASIGQVHRATLKSTGEKVAVKIQFPGVADSINSDLDNLSMLLAASNMLPKGLYLNKTIDNARTELGWECDYVREAECGEKYRELLADEPDVFAVPKIYAEASGKHVLTMQYMEGVGVTRVTSFTQEQRDWIGTQILRLCLREITEFRFMQTDPNWTNFLYNAQTHKLELLDFGASRAFPDEFVVQYIGLLAAAARSDRQTVKDLSEKLGYLTGHESRTMLDAHIASVLTLAEPFLDSAPEVYDFKDQTITERVKALIPVMIRERLAPPPEETYSLHRKLSGAFLLCAKLGSKVRCREMFEKAVTNVDFEGQK
ncbi:molecular chaperone [Apiospora saccharicola]|uniref:Molecular chaperone n=1 Tax=Apiospora saccharicola TaxID=335842 RepID=A0ABR1TKX5_9PEZI